MNISIMEKCKRIKGKNIEIMLIVLLLVLLIISIITDKHLIALPKFMLMNVAEEESQDLINTVFSVQATVATVSIAILALLSNMIKESIYGLPISRYITNDKHYFFKHHYLISIGLILVLFSYYFTAMQLYNAVIFLFFITIMGVLKMAKDIFIIFSGNHGLKENIRGYVIENYRKIGYLENLKYDFQDTIYENDTRKLKDNFLLIEELMEKEINMDDGINESTVDAIKDIYIDSFNNIFETGNEDKYIFCWEKIINLYRIANSDDNPKKHPLTIDVWEKCSDEFYQTLRDMSFEKLHSTFIYELHDELYKNITDVKKNTHGLESFIQYIYYYIFGKQNNLITNGEKTFLCRYFFQILRIRMSYGIKDKSDSEDKKIILLKETLLFIKMLIDRNEKEIFYECFVNEFLKIGYLGKENNDIFRDLGFCILIYVYYVGCCEKNSKEEQKMFCQSLLKDSFSEVSSFMENNKIKQLTQEYFDKIYSYIHPWEIFLAHEAKFEVMGNTIKDFYIFMTLHETFHEEELATRLLAILKEETNYIVYYSSYVKNMDDAKKRYSEFINCIYGSKEAEQQETIETKFEDLKKIILLAYKEGEIAEANKIVFTEAKSNEFEKRFQNSIEGFLKDNLSRYSKFEPTSKDSYKFEKLFYSEEIYNNMTGEYFSNEAIELYAKKFLADIYSIVFNNSIKFEKAQWGTNDKLSKMLPNIKDPNSTFDTIVGDTHFFYADKQREVFEELIKDKESLKIDFLGSVFIIFNSSKLSIRLKNVNVKIYKRDETEILEMYEKTKEGLYLFKFVNEVEIPITKEELLSIYEDKYSVLETNIEFEFAAEQSIIGYGLVIG